MICVIEPIKDKKFKFALIQTIYMNPQELHVDYNNRISVIEILNTVSDYQHKSVAVSPSVVVPGEHALVAHSNIAKNSVIFIYRGELSYIRTRTSIQIGVNEHLEAGDFGSYTNHSCAPNAVLRSHIYCNVGMVALIAIRHIAIGEEITFDYATTETDLTIELKQHRCLCGSEYCRGNVFSFADLQPEMQIELIQKNLHALYMTNFVVVDATE